MEIMPNHIAIVPDGNRRWAKARGLDPWEGHKEGADNTEKIIERARKLGVFCLSIWGSSEDNLTKRPFAEKKALLEIYLKNFKRLLEGEEIHRDRVRISVIGKWREQFPAPLASLLERCIEETKRYEKHRLNFFLAYNGTTEMLEATRSIAAMGKAGAEVTAQTIKDHLWTRELPPVDLLVRTGGEPHLSAGFMMWDIADAQLFFSEKPYPDFGPDDFEGALADYTRRERRRGK